MRIGIYAIAKDEIENFEGWLGATETADYRLLVDTGSTDGTVRAAHLVEYGLGATGKAPFECKQISVAPFRFDDAWNAALAFMPDNIDVCIHLGLDIRPDPDWREKIEQAWPTDTDHAVMQCWFESDALRWRYPFVHSRHGYRWHYPIHELVMADPRIESVNLMSELTFRTFGSRQSSEENRDRNIALLEAARTENPSDPRLLHYLGREYMYAGKLKQAVEMFELHCGSNDFPAQRSESWRYIGDCFVLEKPIREVPLGPYKMATKVAPDRREGWVALADLCRKQDRWQMCLESAEKALEITEQHWYFNWPFAWGANPYDLAGLGAWFVGDVDKAREYGQRALELEPENDRLKNNLAWFVVGEPPIADQEKMDALATW
jgi:tetratricopeptide (TPR) repeat protein